MRFVFPNLTRPKKSAKIIARNLSIPLASTQRAIARVCGYDDWYDFERSHAKGLTFELDQDLPHSEFIERHTTLSLSLASELNVPDGDAQDALADCRLTGDRFASLYDQIELRLNCWRRTILPPAAKRSRGAVGTIKSPGWNGDVIILRSFGRPTRGICEKNVTKIADFEYVSPRNPPPMFLPVRLYLPYGYWIEQNGAKVLFARDYMPMWRIREGAPPERLEPWLWIKYHDTVFLWDENRTPWESKELSRKLENLLAEFGVQALPIWADALPLLVHDDSLDTFSDAIEPLKLSRGLAEGAAA
jgi:hypothetical protein